MKTHKKQVIMIRTRSQMENEPHEKVFQEDRMIKRAHRLTSLKVCTRRAGKLYKARSRLYRSQILQVNTRWNWGLFEKRLREKVLVGKLSPRSTQCTPLHRFAPFCTVLESVIEKPGQKEPGRSLISSNLSHVGPCSVLGHFRLSFHGHAFDDVWSFRNCSFKASREKRKRKKNMQSKEFCGLGGSAF